MSDSPQAVPPYFKGDLTIDSPLSAAWARTLDNFQIAWVYEPKGIPQVSRQGRPCFRLNEMNMVLEIAHFASDLKEPRWEMSQAPSSDSIVITGHEFGSFRFRDLPRASHLNLLMYCTSCSRYFFSPSLETPCGFCGALKPCVQEYEQISGFDDLEDETLNQRDLRQWLNDNLRDWAARERPFLPLVPFPVANTLFEEKEVEKAKARESNTWDKLLVDLSGPAFVHRWPQAEEIEALKGDYPNFGEVCDFLVHEIRLSPHQPSQAVELPNILLVGGPSCGKSSFAERLAQILVSDDFARVDLGQATTNFALVGSDSGFKHGKEGRILRLMAGSGTKKPVRNPLVILDELDKAFPDSTFNPLPALLSLLEKGDAKRFVDEFFAAPVDASGINFLALANTHQTLSSPLLSRFMVFHIQDYTRSQFAEVVIPAIYQEWRARFFPGTFPETLSSETRLEIAEAAGGVPRQVSAILDQLVSSDHRELFPRPTWESLGQARANEVVSRKLSNRDEGVNHE